MSPKLSGVPRPLKKAEFEIQFATRQAEKGWQDLLAIKCNAVVDAWDFLTKTPQDESELNHQLKGGLATLTHKGETFAGGSWSFPAEPGCGSTSTGSPSG